jgi:hypothetical protein
VSGGGVFLGEGNFFEAANDKTGARIKIRPVLAKLSIFQKKSSLDRQNTVN